MMVLIDTTVWIDFFAGRELSHVAVLEHLSAILASLRRIRNMTMKPIHSPMSN